MPKRIRTSSVDPAHAAGAGDSDSDSDSDTLSPPPQHVPRLSTPPTEQPVMTCDLLPTCRPLIFGTYEEYESHYRQTHTNRCSDCGCNFPTVRYLEVHIRENHDPLAQLKRERGEKIYECYVDGCDKVCMTRARRKLHLIDKHKFPKDFYWAVIDKGIDGRQTLLNTPKLEPDNTITKTLCTATTKPVGHEDLDSLSSTMNSLKLVPRSVQLGSNRKGR